MSNNNDYTTGNLLDFAYCKENYKLIAIDLSKQTKLKDPQQIQFIGELDKTNGATMFCGNNNTNVAFKTCAPFENVLQKLMVLLLMKQILLILQCLSTI